MTSNKSYVLVFFLLCFCFSSTSYAQPCLSETNLTFAYSCPLELEENNEPDELFTGHTYQQKSVKASKPIPQGKIKSLLLHSIACCNRDPPRTSIYHKPYSIL